MLKTFPAFFVAVATVFMPCGAACARVDLCVKPYTRLILKDTVAACLRDAKSGSVNAKYYLGMFYYLEDGVRENVPMAVRWFTAAAAAGHLTSQKMLGYIFRVGDGVPRNLDKAAKWYSAAAKRGDRDAKLALGGVYLEQLGEAFSQLPEAYGPIAEAFAKQPNRIGLALRSFESDVGQTIQTDYAQKSDFGPTELASLKSRQRQVASAARRLSAMRLKVAPIRSGTPVAVLCRQRVVRRQKGATLEVMSSSVGRGPDLRP